MASSGTTSTAGTVKTAAIDGAPRGVYVGGEWRLGDRQRFEVRNPARPAEVVGVSVYATAEDVREACEAARQAAGDWRRVPAVERGRILYKAATILEQRAEAVAADLVREEGKPIAEAAGEVQRAISVFRYFAGETSQPSGEVYPSAAPGRHLYTETVPLGVVGVITPWNFPIAIPAWKIAPALAFGNTVVWKPANLTPITSVNLVDLLVEAGLPPGVLNLVCGGRDPVGETLVQAPELDGISFTGSTAVGRGIERIAVERGVKVQLELGGKNPLVVLDDADVDEAVRSTIRGAMASSGQKCTATSRVILVGEGESYVENLVEAVNGLRIGDPMSPETDVGPLASKGQYETVLSYFDIARDEQLKLETGGEPDRGNDGYFVKPTVYSGVDPGSRLAKEEIFGPVATILPADSLEDAVRIANDVDFGLSASIFTRDIGAAFRFVTEVEAAIVHVNADTTISETQVPFGGMKDSGSHSREQGKAARDFYTSVKTVYVDMPNESR